MRERLVIGIDVDGVLASFTQSFVRRLYEVTGKALAPAGFEPSTWEWPTLDLGYTTEEETAAWASANSDRSFWQTLLPFAETQGFLAGLNFSLDTADEVYFITKRRGIEAKVQTERWLEAQGFWNPTVLIARSGRKGGIAKALGLTHFIDDKPENCIDVLRKSKDTAVYIMRRKYNENSIGYIEEHINGHSASALEDVFEGIFGRSLRAAA